jgi:hypothetical protein
MSKNASSYSKYLSSKKCCNYLSNVNCLGQTGPTGSPGIGIQGNTGPSGISITGPTGPTSTVTGPTGGKSFIIDHPLDPTNKYLIHMCLEGPEAGVYYRGKSAIDNLSTIIQLPDYVSALANDFTVHISAINSFNQYSASLVENNQFTVYSDDIGEFNWIVFGKRKDCVFDIEPNKEDIVVHGDGPYLYHSCR